MASFSWKGIFGINGSDNSSASSSRNSSIRKGKKAGGIRSASNGNHVPMQENIESLSPEARQAQSYSSLGTGSLSADSPLRTNVGISPPGSHELQSPSRSTRSTLSSNLSYSVNAGVPDQDTNLLSTESTDDTETNLAIMGIENFGNTCYANSVLQALYFCAPFREAIMRSNIPYSSQSAAPARNSELLQTALIRLFRTISAESSRLSRETADASSKSDASGNPIIYTKTVDTEAIKSFLETLMRKSDLFDTSMHHDAHEFLNFTLNQIGEDLIAMQNKQQERSISETSEKKPPLHRTCVHDLFQGILTNETKCLTCENVSYRDEEFLDLSINVSPYTSVSSCLRQFSESEMLHGKNKFFCDACASLQEAEKRMKIRHAPNILALHLKRFKWEPRAQSYVKHACRVVFPLDLRLFNMSDKADNPDRRYDLFAVVIHVGAGANQGHYISIIKIGKRWALFDDDCVTYIPESDIAKYYGDSPETGSAYVLFYQATDSDEGATQIPPPSQPITLQKPNAVPTRVLSNPRPTPTLDTVNSAPSAMHAMRGMPIPIAASRETGSDVSNSPSNSHFAPASTSTFAPASITSTNSTSSALSPGPNPAVPLSSTMLSTGSTDTDPSTKFGTSPVPAYLAPWLGSQPMSSNFNAPIKSPEQGSAITQPTFIPYLNVAKSQTASAYPNSSISLANPAVDRPDAGVNEDTVARSTAHEGGSATLHTSSISPALNMPIASSLHFDPPNSQQSTNQYTLGSPTDFQPSAMHAPRRNLVDQVISTTTAMTFESSSRPTNLASGTPSIPRSQTTANIHGKTTGFDLNEEKYESPAKKSWLNRTLRTKR
ncbi:ubiquitinyl hydrolase 1 [Malassezia yamatoensis]|uniref:Ubiquitin carboxyl-terminal hydrolase n=1 Tax=Malassezia yamatoensis TaxID=253288 RepID=A0AAJ6CIA9_9BASI|nr:ubiquitinyl hydrolase 1 [Malassezia yamatoensis]